jgi:hypothetical protein
MRALTHLFGSVDGYRTLARSPGLGEAEDAALAAMGFGSPQRAEEFDRLDGSLCAAGRPLPGGRYAITRLFKAGLDVAGRQTVERRTIVLAPEQWAEVSLLDLGAILASEALWRREAFAEGREVQVPMIASEDLLPSATETDRRAYDALLSARDSGRCALLPGEPKFEQAVLRLARLLPREEALSLGWGVGLWSMPSGVSLATVRELTRQRNAFAAPTAGAWRHPERIEALGGDGLSRPRAVATPEPAVSRFDTRRLAWGLGGLAALAALLAVVIAWFTAGTRAPAPLTPVTPPPTTVAPAPTVAATPTPPPQQAPVAPPAASARPDDRPGFGSNPAAGAGFGQEPAPPPETAPASPAAAPQPAPAVVPPTPAATPPQLPPPPPQSTPWDEEVQVLRESVDLVQSISAATTGTGQPDASLEALAQRLKARCDELAVRARRCMESDKPDRVFTFDARGGGPGLSEALREQLGTGSGAPPAGVVRCTALLAARFQLRVGASAIRGAVMAHPSLLQQLSWKTVLRNMDEVREWPATPFSTWYAAGKDTRRDLSTTAAVRLLAGKLAADLPQAGGMKPLVQELKRAVDALPQEPAP